MKVKILFFAIIFAILTFSGCESSLPNSPDSSDSQNSSGSESHNSQTDDSNTTATLYEPLALEPFEGALSSRSVYVLDMNNGESVFAFDETARMNPASTTKIMTVLVALEELGEGNKLDELVEIPWLIYAGFDTDDPNTIGGSLAGIIAGQENVTYRDCLYGIMLPSGNDASNIIAYNVGGGNMDIFVEKMNKKAKELGCVNTNFSNAHGLLEVDNWSCTYDLALIAQYAYEKYPLFRELSSGSNYVMPGNEVYGEFGYVIGNSNAFVRQPKEGETSIYYRDFVKGIKTGALNEYFLKGQNGEWVEYAGIANLVSLGQKNGRSYIIVTLEAPYKYGDLTDADGNRMNRLHYAYTDHILLYDWLFANS